MNTLNNAVHISFIKPENSLIVNPKFYSKPILIYLDDVRSITLGGSPGVGESSGSPTPPPLFP